MNLLKTGIAVVLLGLMVSATAAQAQDVGVRKPQAPKPCYDPAGSRACQPGPAIDVAALISGSRGKRAVLRLPGRSLKFHTPLRRSR